MSSCLSLSVKTKLLYDLWSRMIIAFLRKKPQTIPDKLIHKLCNFPLGRDKSFENQEKADMS